MIYFQIIYGGKMKHVNPYVLLFLGVTIGFLLCQKIYKGMDNGFNKNINNDQFHREVE